ncbi:MAG: phage tail protein [Anaerolineae bacterium]|nr:phage tail protein [Anaerolineae bacterium]
MPATAQRYDATLNFLYRIEIEGVNHAVFSECKLPSFQVETLEIKEGGQNNFTHQLPVRVKAGSITLKYGITKSDALLKWYLDVLKALLKGNLQQVTRNVNVVLLSIDHKTMSTFSLESAYPKKWSGPTLKADDKAVAIEELELAFTNFSVQ